MFIPGLVSITFRSLSPESIVRAVVEAGLSAIEWGSDVHVPAGHLTIARDTRTLTLNAGLQISAYGSYYRVGANAPDAFSPVLDSASQLGAHTIRVWAGQDLVTSTMKDSQRRKITDDLRRICDLAAISNIRIATEWHGGTLTDTAQSSQRLFDEVAHANLATFWQPRERTTVETCLIDLETALPRLAGVHVFHWDAASNERLPLSAGESQWSRYFARIAAANHDLNPCAMLEFVRGESLEQFAADAKTLLQLLSVR